MATLEQPRIVMPTVAPSKRRTSRKSVYVGIAILLAVVVSVLAYPRVVEEIAYIRGMQSYVYGFPLVLMDVTNGVLTATPKAGEYKAPINQFFRIRTYVSPDFKDVVRISRNSLWSVAVLDLEKEPVVISHPDTGGRFVVVQMMNMWTDDFGSVGSRTTGSGSGKFLIAGPKWSGTAPTDIKDIYKCATRYAWVLVQISAKSPEEFPAINAIQDQLKVTPLSAWGRPYMPPDNVPVDPAVDTTSTPFDQVRLMDAATFFNRLAHVMKDNPPYATDSSMQEKLRKLGVEPGKDFDASRVDPNVLKGLNRVPAQIWNTLASAPYQMKGVNGWLLPLNLGRYGNDYNTRAFIAYVGLGALTSDDAIYPSVFVDADGNPLLGTHKYTMHFPKGEILPSKAGVWSISQYRENFYVHNPIERYSILPSMPIKYNEDGSLDIYLQAQSPGADKESNWLPLPLSGPVNLTIRVYQPKPEMFDGQSKDNLMVGPATYTIPPVKKVE